MATAAPATMASLINVRMAVLRSRFSAKAPLALSLDEVGSRCNKGKSCLFLETRRHQLPLNTRIESSMQKASQLLVRTRTTSMKGKPTAMSEQVPFPDEDL